MRTDAPGDPRVAVVGGSYGGALALLLAGQDRRVDAIVPSITWNDLTKVFLPQSADTTATGVFKKGWAGLFFGNGAATGEAGGVGGLTVPTGESGRGGRAGGRARTPPAGASPPTSAPPTSRLATAGTPDAGHHSLCCASPARPRCSTRSRRRPC